jgi:hypothetical protein
MQLLMQYMIVVKEIYDSKRIAKSFPLLCNVTIPGEHGGHHHTHLVAHKAKNCLQFL